MGRRGETGGVDTKTRRFGFTAPTELMERLQDVVATCVGLTLIVLAAVLLVVAIVDFFRHMAHLSLVLDAADLLDSILLVLILVEIVHTVVLSLRAHALSAEPFIVVGLVAVVRKILFSLGSGQKASVSQLSLYLAMAAVFVASLVALQLLQSRRGARAA